MRCTCLLLGAGQGRRMGGPKALLLAKGDTPLAVHHAKRRGLDCERVVLVTRKSTASALSAYQGGLDIVVSEEPDEHGPAGSIVAAVRSGKLRGAELVLLTPVDVPPVGQETVRLLTNAITSGVDASRPRLGERRGHPVVCRGDVLEESYATGSEPRPLRDVLEQMAERCVDVDVDDPAVLLDLDDPESFRNWCGEGPRFFQG